MNNKKLEKIALIEVVAKICGCNAKTADKFLSHIKINKTSSFIDKYGYFNPDNFDKIRDDFGYHIIK